MPESSSPLMLPLVSCMSREPSHFIFVRRPKLQGQGIAQPPASARFASNCQRWVDFWPVAIAGPVSSVVAPKYFTNYRLFMVLISSGYWVENLLNKIVRVYSFIIKSFLLMKQMLVLISFDKVTRWGHIEVMSNNLIVAVGGPEGGAPEKPLKR